MFISTAWAQGGGAGGGLFEAIIPLVLIFAVFYFLLIRPQQRKVKLHREMLGQLRRGDRVITGGGIFGTVTKVVNDNEVIVQITDGVRVRIARGTIADVMSKPEPARSERPERPERPEKSEKREKIDKSEKPSSDVAAS